MKHTYLNMRVLKPLETIAEAIAIKCSEAVKGGEPAWIRESSNVGKNIFDSRYGNVVITVAQYYNRVELILKIVKTEAVEYKGGVVEKLTFDNLETIQGLIDFHAKGLASLLKAKFDEINEEEYNG